MSYRKLDDLTAHLSTLLERHDLNEIEFNDGKLQLRISRKQTTAPHAPHPRDGTGKNQDTGTDETPPSAEETQNVVTSPMVGTIYLASEPGKPPYVKEGQHVKKGDTLMLIEAMKTFNPITASHAGIVGEIFVSEGDPAEFGDRLLILQPHR